MPDKVSARTVAVFACAGAAIGSLNAGLVFLLLIYYHRVLGLEPSLVGLALGVSLALDALVDPFVGYVSDHWRSRLGRRHPFLLASLVPLAGGYLLIWFPPFDASQQLALFAYLLGGTIVLRVGITLFDIPANALIAEITRDYEARTRLSQAKVSMTWMMVNVVSILTFTYWLVDTPGAPGSGLLDRDGYRTAAVWVSAIVLVLAASFPLGLWRQIPMLRANAEGGPAAPAGFRGIARELVDTYRSRAVLALLIGATFLAAAGGLQQSLWLYIQSAFFGLRTDQIIYLQVTYLSAAVAAMVLLPRLARGRDKRDVALTIAAFYWPFAVVNVALRLGGLAPANGSPLLLPLLCLHGFLDGVMLNMLMALMLSMLSDAVDSTFLRTGRREEGVLLAGQTFVTKSSMAMGTMLAGALLSVSHFPRDGAAAPEAVLRHLGLLYTPTVLLMGVASIAALWRYDLRRKDHQAHLQQIGEPASPHDAPDAPLVPETAR